MESPQFESQFQALWLLGCLYLSARFVLGVSVEASLVLIGVSYRTAPIEVRERFSLAENRVYETLSQLSRFEGIAEVAVLSTTGRTEFLVWADDMMSAANSVLTFLTRTCGLTLSEWSHFYRLFGPTALNHVFRLASGLDSVESGEIGLAAQVKSNCDKAEEVGTAGKYLNAIAAEALSVSAQVAAETRIELSLQSLPQTIFSTAREVLGDLFGRTVLLLGCGGLAETIAHDMAEAGANIQAMSHSPNRAAALAASLKGSAIPIGSRWRALAEADVFLSSSSSPHVVLSRDIAEGIAQTRRKRPLLIFDLAIPRDVEPSVDEVDSIRLYDLDSVRHKTSRAGVVQADLALAEQIVAGRTGTFAEQLFAPRELSPAKKLREQLSSICTEELGLLEQQQGPFTTDQRQVFDALISRVVTRVADRALAGPQGSANSDGKMVAALRNLLHGKESRAFGARTKN